MVFQIDEPGPGLVEVRQKKIPIRIITTNAEIVLAKFAKNAAVFF